MEYESIEMKQLSQSPLQVRMVIVIDFVSEIAGPVTEGASLE